MRCPTTLSIGFVLGLRDFAMLVPQGDKRVWHVASNRHKIPSQLKSDIPVVKLSVPEAADLARRNGGPAATTFTLDDHDKFHAGYARQKREAFDVLILTVRAAIRDDLYCDMITSRENMAWINQREGSVAPGIIIKAGTVEAAALSR